MSFKTLEDRFNEKVNDLYAASTVKFAGGKPSSGKFDQPFLTRKPGDSQPGITIEGRSSPFVSAPSDLKRLTLFQFSGAGIRFLAKQQLLQTGNTFEITRFINPAFVVANAVPFLHINRKLRPIKEIFGKTDARSFESRKHGQLQVGTFNDSERSWKAPAYLDFLKKPYTRTFSILGQQFDFNITQLIKPLVNSQLRKASIFSAKLNIGEQEGYGADGWKKTRPEISTFYPYIQKQLNDYQAKDNDFFINDALKENAPKQQSFLRYFDSDGQFAITSRAGSTNAKELAQQAKQNNVKLSYIKDGLNKDDGRVWTSAYSNLPKISSDRSNDPIIVSFAMGKDDPVQFRAFLTNLKENASPSYNEQQYIGRIEKFISYTGVVRTITFDLAVIAFSKDELDVVWRRINYLTGMVFPYGFNKGIMQPNIIRLSIGNVYRDQPGYITALSKDFNNPSDSWDIDKEVPIGATMSISFTLIEKATRIYDSPFYAIHEQKFNPDRTTGFRDVLQVPSETAPVELPDI